MEAPAARNSVIFLKSFLIKDFKICKFDRLNKTQLLT